MPTITRWFPVTHDLNSDPELWEMRHTIGEKSLSIWLEFLSIADRNSGELPGDLEELVRTVAGKCQATKRTVLAVYHFATSHVWLASELPLRVVNYAKYHRTRVPTQRSSEPNLTKPNLKSVRKQTLDGDFLLPDWMPKNEWEEFVALRKRKHAPLTESIAKRVIAVLRDLMDLGHPPAEVLTEAVDRNWTGIKREWIHKNGGFERGKFSERTQRILKRGL